jgi:5-methyltetrahydrofolate--homocysteine methyltransferase
MALESIVEDWSRVKQRWEAWWNCELVDRPLVCVTAPRAVEPSRENLAVDPRTQWTDVEFMIRRTREMIRTTWYGGEALPIFWHGWSAGHALLFGCEPHFSRDTVWVNPAPVEEEGYPRLDCWRESPWWPWMQACTEAAARSSQGQYWVMPVWGNHAADNLALMRHSDQLMLDLAENPAWVKEAVKMVSEALIEQTAALWELVRPERTGLEGSLNYVSCWSPGRTLGFDADVSCMVSPEMFKEFFLPPLVETMQTVDHRIYHLDGVCALHHLDTLLDLPELHAIQWVPGAGREEIMQWVPVIQRIQERSKAIVVYSPADQVEALLREIRPEGLCIGTWCASESDGRRLLERVGRRRT